MFIRAAKRLREFSTLIDAFAAAFDFHAAS
jgi:hypothetical protein